MNPLEALSAIFSLFGNAQSQRANQEISHAQFKAAQKAYEENLKKLTEQFELDWFTAEKMYGTAIYDIDGDGKITTSDYNRAPAILKTQMRDIVSGTTEDVAGKEVIVQIGRGEPNMTNDRDYIYQIYETDAGGNWRKTRTYQTSKYVAPGKTYAGYKAVDQDFVTEPVDIGFTPDAKFSKDVTLGEVGQYREDVHTGKVEEHERLWGDDGYYAKIFGGQQETYNALKDAYTNAGLPTPTEAELRARYEMMIKEGDPELQKLLDEEANRAYGVIRGQGQEAMQHTLGQVVGTGLENSIVARELVSQTDDKTLKALAETAREIAIANKKAQFEVKKGAQTSLDTLNLSLDARKRSSLLSLAGLTKPVETPAPAGPIKPPLNYTYPQFGSPGIEPTDVSGGYNNPWALGGDFFKGMGKATTTKKAEDV